MVQGYHRGERMGHARRNNKHWVELIWSFRQKLVRPQSSLLLSGPIKRRTATLLLGLDSISNRSEARACYLLRPKSPFRITVLRFVIQTLDTTILL